MNDTCSHCEASFEPEPGFYFGAMFVSYAINVGLILAIGFIIYLTYSPEDWVYIISVSVTIILFSPFTYRVSRILYLYAFGGLRED
ncbi:MAG: DUF983 domain-containing protein [Flammeovirgaceae bacterium]|nr:DUF983 domain-containing protein [Flammeovirgaceae bacterium]